jgi:hypothetical protein
MRFGTWNVRSLYRAGLFTVAARQLARYIIRFGGYTGDWVGQRCHTESTRLVVSMEKETKNIN